jgi:ubiquinone/menaquinone biosynthesis C-methylase UbiE
VLNPLRSGGNPHVLVVGMTGVKLGERFAQVGCAHGGRLAAVAAKVGLSGRAVAIVPDERSAARARKGAADAGVLVEVEMAPPTRMPLKDEGIDLAVIDETAGLLRTLTSDDRTATVREVLRILRPGGRVLVVASAPRSGIGAWLTRAPGTLRFDPSPELQAGGFKSVRTLAEREGLVFVEGIKPRRIS